LILQKEIVLAKGAKARKVGARFARLQDKMFFEK
jgi:hypothetical protein